MKRDASSLPHDLVAYSTFSCVNGSKIVWPDQRPRRRISDYTIRERIADGCIHVIGVTASLVALTALLIIGVRSETLSGCVSLTIYGLALVATFSFSAGYHLVVRPKLKEVLRRLDHAAIFLMIAATYTPFILIKMQTPWGFGLLAVVWTMAAIGIAIKLFAPRFLDGLVDRALSGARLGGDCRVGAVDVGAAGRRR